MASKTQALAETAAKRRLAFAVMRWLSVRDVIQA
jgi:hypothetical protein